MNDINSKFSKNQKNKTLKEKNVDCKVQKCKRNNKIQYTCTIFLINKHNPKFLIDSYVSLTQ